MRSRRNFPHHRHIPKYRPPWWPEDSEWPPKEGHWPRRPPHFFIRLVFLFALMLILACIGLVFITGVMLSELGVPGIPELAPRPGIFLGIFFFLIFFGIVLAFRAFRKLAYPLNEILNAANRVANGDYQVRVETKHIPPEVRDLARTFNTMTGRLRTQEDLRRTLMADITHELRTPLTIIEGNLEGLLEGIYPRDDDHLKAIQKQTHLISRLIDDLQTLTQAESGILKLQKESVDLPALIQDTTEAFHTQTQETGIKLSFNPPSGLPLVYLDPVRIREVLSNLVVNAMRYTPEDGTITICCNHHEDQLSVSVSDTGSGIPAEILPHIFDRFYKSADSGGSGLGLAICKNLVTLHGGEISATSSKNGTTFSFTLPIQ